MEDAFQSSDLVHFTTGCRDADRLQLKGEKEPDQKQELSLLQTTKGCIWDLLQHTNGLLQTPFLASFHTIPVHRPCKRNSFKITPCSNVNTRDSGRAGLLFTNLKDSDSLLTKSWSASFEPPLIWQFTKLVSRSSKGNRVIFIPCMWSLGAGWLPHGEHRVPGMSRDSTLTLRLVGAVAVALYCHLVARCLIYIFIFYVTAAK